MRLTWRKQPSERGLASVCQSPRGLICKVDGEDVADVSPLPVGFHRYDGWYWVAVSDFHPIPLKNTCKAPCKTIDEAKAQAERYVRECLKAK